MVSERSYYCGLDAAIDVIGGKWKALILWELRDGARRFGELRRGVVGISEKMLIQQVRELEADGLVHREAYHEIPPRVEYSLTELGASLSGVLLQLCEWGERHAEHIHAIRRCEDGQETARR
jgi:DNA-binding HxlR family transcriptional regulator